jgi:drug/metabolite transporter superfamily protein YnfA
MARTNFKMFCFTAGSFSIICSNSWSDATCTITKLRGWFQKLPLSKTYPSFIILAAYDIVATWQSMGFGWVYAAYGGVFMLMALIWTWQVDGFKPDKYDIIGALGALAGACIIIFTPRAQ